MRKQLIKCEIFRELTKSKFSIKFKNRGTMIIYIYILAIDQIRLNYLIQQSVLIIQMRKFGVPNMKYVTV